MNEKHKNEKSRNPDPITGAPGSHPVGTGIGAVAGGAATGAAVGTAAGPVGTVAGAAVGAIGGGLIGKSVAEKVNPTQEDMYWRHNHFREPYGTRPYSDYQAAYRAGYAGYAEFGGGNFDEKEAEIRRRYEADKANARLPWTDARQAARAAWHRLEGNSERLIGYEVQDQSYTSVGKVHSVWTDETGQPVFIGVKTSWIFGKNHVVPAHNATVNTIRRVVQLPFTEAMIKNAPAFAESAELSDDDQSTIYRHYDIGTKTRPVSTVGAQCDVPRTDKEQTIALREEKLKVGKREVEAGGVRIRKIVRTETVDMPVELKREEFVMERVPASEAGANAGPIGEDDIYLPLRREEAVIQKDTEVREGVRIGRKSETERQTVTEQVRKEDIQIERQGSAKNPKR